ncbi:hypothetical protein GCK72_011465 [Caenorhabditis remanei]|uniref:Uncharacterized protein n=1 Tax=Caenorhabditis remanei TaxID=31234 RepID=A0A6A5H822_CAERE|nr:hypothetical protein GCK72_011465 [Caenorhabditis remanei]KAF1763199.1 hypothetical protein GCK72_011465 [Caenorhabditis remanei]
MQPLLHFLDDHIPRWRWMSTAQLNFQLRNKRPVYLEFLHRNGAESGILQFTDDWSIDRTLLYRGRKVTVQQYFEKR